MQISEDRRALHRIPELDKNLPKTMAYVEKSLGKVYANSRLSVIMRMESAEKLLQNSRMPKHWANAQQCFAGCKRQISAFAAAEKDNVISGLLSEENRCLRSLGADTKNYMSFRASAHTGVGIPRLEGKIF